MAEQQRHSIQDTSQLDLLSEGKPPIAWSKIVNRALTYTILIIVALIFVYPMAWLVSVSLKPPWETYRQPLNLVPDAPTISAYTEVIEATPLPQYFLNSIIYGFGGGLIRLFLSALAAYGLSRYYFRGKRLFLAALLVLQMIPGLVTMIPIFIMIDALGMIDTRQAIIILYSAIGIPFGIWFLKGFVDSIPIELEEAAWIDGASRFRAFIQIVIPGMMPGMVALFILGFIQAWNDFLTPLIVLRSPELLPMTVGTFRIMNSDGNNFQILSSAALINIVPVIVIYAFLQRYLVRGLAGAVKG